MDQASVVVQHSDDRRSFVTREIGGETLIVPVTGHVMDLESIYVLNPVASRIWGLLRSPITAERLADVIAGEFEVSPQEASRDVAEFLDSLSTRGLIQELPQGG
jgi:Coenzyme PQQ synthesis protein D (PqqD)